MRGVVQLVEQFDGIDGHPYNLRPSFKRDYNEMGDVQPPYFLDSLQPPAREAIEEQAASLNSTIAPGQPQNSHRLVLSLSYALKRK